MPELVETPPLIKEDDNIIYNTRLRLVSEKINEKSQDRLMLFQVLCNSENDELFALMEELETKKPDSIMCCFRGQRDYIFL